MVYCVEVWGLEIKKSYLFSKLVPCPGCNPAFIRTAGTESVESRTGGSNSL